MYFIVKLEIAQLWPPRQPLQSLIIVHDWLIPPPNQLPIASLAMYYTL